MAEAQGIAFNESANALARAFWPGPLTLVLPGGSGRLPDLLRGPEGGLPCVGRRIHTSRASSWHSASR
jgi:tRNA A37 threonylcarbamoyladenosine synthetase subunit TsaC/SUA5/YrdC